MRPQAVAVTGSNSTEPGNVNDDGHGDAVVVYPHSTSDPTQKVPEVLRPRSTEGSVGSTVVPTGVKQND